jgi:hypothetical protein
MKGGPGIFARAVCIAFSVPSLSFLCFVVSVSVAGISPSILLHFFKTAAFLITPLPFS